MKKILALILSVTLAFSMTACSSKGSVYTPVYGDKLEISENLTFKKEYKESISPETRQLISEYITFMVNFYNDIDPSQQQPSYYTYTVYYFTNNFLTNMEIEAASVLAKIESGTELSESEQLFWQCLEKIFEIPNKLTEIDTDAMTNAAANSAPSDDSSSDADSSQVEYLTLDRALWEEFFNVYVDVISTLYDKPFVK